MLSPEVAGSTALGTDTVASKARLFLYSHTQTIYQWVTIISLIGRHKKLIPEWYTAYFMKGEHYLQSNHSHSYPSTWSQILWFIQIFLNSWRSSTEPKCGEPMKIIIQLYSAKQNFIFYHLWPKHAFSTRQKLIWYINCKKQLKHTALITLPANPTNNTGVFAAATSSWINFSNISTSCGKPE